MTLTQILNHVFNLVCLVASVGSEVMADPAVWGLIPPKYAHYISAVALGAMWLKSKRNLLINPDGTPAWTAWARDPKK